MAAPDLTADRRGARPGGALVFIGFMGAGKTTAAREAATVLGAEAVDTDAELERRLGTTVDECFADRGEASFREEEERVAGELLERADGGVVALGGGSLGSQRVRAALQSHTAVWLDVDLDTAWDRVGGSSRPLARDLDAFRALHAERQPAYAAAADAILPPGGGSMIRRALPALRALAQAPGGTRMAWGSAGSGDYPVYVGEGLLAARFAPPVTGRGFCVTDTTVARLYPDAFEACPCLVEIPPGEEHKELETAQGVLRTLAAGGMTRADHVLAIGGGVVGDLAGFCAATYQRGVPVVQVPTTLVAQVDAAYGGKTGVDLPEGKNYVGAYHQPAVVVADPGVLRTLPPEELAAGHAEVIKTALIAGGELWERVRAGAGIDPDVVLACARTKLRVVAADERDEGPRQVLNLGHTVAHAIETATGYRRYLHGQAVALGLLAALRLSGAAELHDEVRGLLAARGLPTTLEGVSAEAVVEATKRDKKRRGEDGVPFVLAQQPGQVRTGCAVGDDELLAAVAELIAR